LPPDPVGRGIDGNDSDGDGISDSQELIDGTNPYDRGSGEQTLNVSICSEWNGFLGGMWNILELVNMSGHTLGVQVTLYNQAGIQESTQFVQVEPGREYDALIHDFRGRAMNSYGNVCFTHNGSPGDLDGRMVYYKENTASRAFDGKSFQFAFAMPMSNGKTGKQDVTINTYQASYLAADQAYPVANWLQLSNVGDDTSSGTLSFYNLDGSLLGSQRVTLSAGQRLDVSGHQFGKDRAGVAEWLPDRNDIPFELRNVRYLYDNMGSEDSFSTAFQLEAGYGSGDVMSVPLTTEGETSIIEVSNTLEQNVNTVVQVFNADGTLISNFFFVLAGHASRHLILDSVLGPNVKGVARIHGSAPGSLIATAMQYGRKADGSIRYMYGLAAKVPFGTVLRGSYNTFLEQDSELVLTNASDSEQNVAVSVKRFSGETQQMASSLRIPAHAVRVLRINDVEPSDVYGVATVQGQAQNSVIAWMNRRRASDYVIPAPVRQ
jgi:hypothetical protein